MKTLTINEIHQILLQMAKEFDSICKRNNIPYYMLGGTMLGAIRHKGFIPWDDDMDFGVPRESYDRLRDIMEKELPSKYRFCVYENSRSVFYPYAKLTDLTTRSESNVISGSYMNKIGVNIDIFPLDYCDKEDKTVRKIIWVADKYGRIFQDSSRGSKFRTILKKVIRFIVPGNKNFWYNYLEKKMHQIPNGDYLANVLGHWETKEIMPSIWYGSADYDFEDIKLSGLVEYHCYLAQLYGDYMKLPSKEKRNPHVGTIYKLEDSELPEIHML